MLGDLISREEVREAVYQARRRPNNEEWERINDGINSVPTVGTIKECEWHRDKGTYICTGCGEKAMRDFDTIKMERTSFCPHCGAKMIL